MELPGPQDERSKHKGHWAGTLGGLLEAGWRLSYTDGTGRKEGAAAVFSQDWRGGGDTKKERWLGNTSTASDAEREAIGLACSDQDTDMHFILTDSQAVLQSVLNISRGSPPRSGIEVHIKSALRQRAHSDTAFSWVLGHRHPRERKSRQPCSFYLHSRRDTGEPPGDDRRGGQTSLRGGQGLVGTESRIWCEQNGLAQTRVYMGTDQQGLSEKLAQTARQGSGHGVHL